MISHLSHFALIFCISTASRQQSTPYFRPPHPKGHVYFSEAFENVHDFNSRWVKSKGMKKINHEFVPYKGQWSFEEALQDGIKNDYGMVLKSPSKHHAISTPLFKAFEFDYRPLMLQYEVKFQNALECGGAYVKLLTRDPELNLTVLNDTTPYTIMFGPDRCGNDAKLHFIIQHLNKVDGTVEEKHCKRPTISLEPFLKDGTNLTHIFTLILRPDGTYVTKIDNTVMTSGSILQDFIPSINPPLEIDDKNDVKPEEWDDRQYIDDPNGVTKAQSEGEEYIADPEEGTVAPSGWLHDIEPYVLDPNSKEPSDYNTELNGKWSPPLIKNPDCGIVGCGPWKPKMIKNPKFVSSSPQLIKNPNYQGTWKPRKIPNPNYYYDPEPFKLAPVSAIGLELWSTTGGILFDNFIITSDKKVLEKWTDDTYYVKRAREEGKGLKGIWKVLMNWVIAYPYLWFIYLTVPVLPVVLIIIWLCAPSSVPTSPGVISYDEKLSDGEGSYLDAPNDDGEYIDDKIIAGGDDDDVQENDDERDILLDGEDDKETEFSTLIHRNPWTP